FRFDGENFHPVAQFNTPVAMLEVQTRRGPFQPPPGSHLHRIMRTKRVSHTADYLAEAVSSPAALGGARSLVAVPMLKDNELIGAFIIYRQEVRPFTDKQIELLQNFAAQAVIAIENTRLLNELRESLEQQTATADVLSIISTFPGELESVFQSILGNATRICAAKFGTLWLAEGDGLRAVAVYNPPPGFANIRRGNLIRPNPKTAVGRVIITKEVVQIVDLVADAAYTERDPFRVALVEVAGARTLVVVPMLKDDALIGALAIYRQESQAFTDKQIALMQNFAAQAVIAVENSGLLSELRESLDRQTATADILRVIASTPEDSKHALDTIAETASHMFGVANVNFRRIDGDVLRIVSSAGPTIQRLRKALPAIPLEPPDPAVRCFFDNRQIPVEDRQAVLTNERGAIAAALRELPVRSQVFTPLSRQGKAIGVMIVTRGEVQPFQQSDLDLMKGFADQAVIAIENARLLNELRERTEE